MLATPTAGLLPSARLLLPRAIREAGAGARNGPPRDATGARLCMWASQPVELGQAQPGRSTFGSSRQTTERRDRPMWAAWKPETRDGRVIKVPYNPVSGRRARSPTAPGRPASTTGARPGTRGAPCSRSSRQSKSPSPTARDDPSRARKPAEPRACALRAKIGSLPCLPSLHLLKVRSLRQIRRGSGEGSERR